MRGYERGPFLLETRRGRPKKTDPADTRDAFSIPSAPTHPFTATGPTAGSTKHKLENDLLNQGRGLVPPSWNSPGTAVAGKPRTTRKQNHSGTRRGPLQMLPAISGEGQERYSTANTWETLQTPWEFGRLHLSVSGGLYSGSATTGVAHKSRDLFILVK